MTPPISQAAIDLIVAAEVSSRAAYERKYSHPEWPGGMSGITIAIGYDVGYATPAKLKADWSGRIPDAMIDALLPCCGVTGSPAQALLAGVRPRVDVPWAQAMAVFDTRDMPDWIAKVCTAIPGASGLSPDCLGALVSLAYNRGASFNNQGDRYAEMRAIRSHIIARDFPAVSRDIRAMKRLWPNVRGLRDRRDAEAALWDKGLRAPVVAPALPPVVPHAPPPMTEPPKPGASEHGSAGAVVIATAGAGKEAVSSGMSPGKVAAIVIGGLIAAVIIWIAVRAWRTAPITARAKG